VSWEDQQKTLLPAVNREAPCWELDGDLFWRKRTGFTLPSTKAAKIRHLFHEIEDLEHFGPARRRLCLVIIDELVESENQLLLQLIDRLKDTNKRHDEVTRNILSLQKESPSDGDGLCRYQDHQATLAGNKAELNKQIGLYPSRGTIRSRAVRKLANDIWDTVELPEEERKEMKKKFKEYARYGSKYSQLHPQGIILFMGNMPSQE
jgi:hypothetical protein